MQIFAQEFDFSTDLTDGACLLLDAYLMLTSWLKAHGSQTEAVGPTPVPEWAWSTAQAGAALPGLGAGPDLLGCESWPYGLCLRGFCAIPPVADAY